MAEQINKNDYINHPDRIGGFNYYSLGETTIKQLQQNNLISSKTRKFQNKKPDAIVTDDEKDIVVYIENKDIGKLSTADDIQSAIDQEIDVAKAVNAPIFVVTDTVEFTKLPGGTIERVKISIPIKEDGSFDLEAQQEIANKYRKIQQINSSIYQQIDELINIKIAL